MMTPVEGYQAVVAAINCCEVTPSETIAMIQLDAYKAGMTRAAEAVDAAMNPYSDLKLNQQYQTARRMFKQAIELTRDNLKEIPND